MTTSNTETALIVGASSSIGPPLVEKLVGLNRRVIATHQKAAPSSDHPLIHRLILDLRSEQSQTSFMEQLGKLDSPIDLAIFVSGILPGIGLPDYDDAVMADVMEVNFTGQAKLLRRLVPSFREGAQVLMVSSISAHAGSYDPIYAASKGAMLSFVKSLAKWHAPRLRVNAIAPGLIKNSAMYAAMSDERRAFHVKETPVKELVDPNDLASIVVDLSAPHWRHLNGACIHVNGGRDVR